MSELPEAETLALDVSCVRLARRRLERRIGIFGVVSAIGPIVALVVLGPLIAAFELEALGLGLLVGIVVGWMVGVPGAAVLGGFFGRAARVPGTRLRVTEETLEVASRESEARRFERKRMTGGMLTRNGDVVATEIDLDDGSVLAIEADPSDALRVLAALELGDSARRRAFEFHSTGALSGCGALITGTLTMSLGVCGLAAVDAEPMPAAYVLGVLFVLPVLVAIWQRPPNRIIIGTDGVFIERLWGSRFVPWSAVENIADDERAWIGVRRGNRVRRVVLASDDQRGAALAAGIREAFAAWQTRDGSAFHAALVERRGRPMRVWREDLARACRSRDYREGFVPIDQLVQITADVDAPVSLRVGAGLALATLDDPHAVDRARTALDGVANERVRIAVDLALSGSADDAALESALEEAEASKMQ